MNPRSSPAWLLSSVSAARELMVKRLGADSLETEVKRAMKVALEELDLMRQELEAQAALLVRENERYAEFFEYAPDAYLVTDAAGVIREANQAARELLSAPRDEVVGHSFSEYIAPAEPVNLLAPTVGLTLGGTAQPLAGRARMQPRDGRALAVEFSARAIALKKSGARGLCWLIRPAPRP